ncbi:MAG: helicase-exonuclease AddAB subunit AddB [Syntrophomonadaceae bacterium]|nr:helicase-exonuclease AddAB subunit AddB [Syntrophomonadaceae bacterium]
MRLRFIIGRAGTGKTTYCLSQIQRELQQHPEGPAIILLVPEQATFQLEAALTSLPGLGGSKRAHVYSFRRLAWKVVQEVGGATRSYLRETGKRMALYNFLQQRKDQLRVFYRAARQPHFADTLANTITEMKRHCLTPSLLVSTAKKMDSDHILLRDKLEDIALLWADFEHFLCDRFSDPDDYLNLLAERLSHSPTCRQAEVWVDGFSGFTPQEYQVLQALMQVSNRVNVALCLDARLHQTPEETELFFNTYQTYTDLLDQARQLGITVEKNCILDDPALLSTPVSGGSSFTAPRFRHNSSLGFLERNFFRWPRQPYPIEAPGIKLVAAHNQHAEVEGAARAIMGLARDQGYCWREISLLVRDLSHYTEPIERVFTDYGIPCFIDYKRPVGHHPLVELLCAALETVASGWESTAVFRFLKTDLVPIPREAVDCLENYVLAHGLRGSRWFDREPWAYYRRYSLGEGSELTETTRPEIQQINALRNQAIGALHTFSISVQSNPSVYNISLALYNLITDLGVREQLQSWSQEAQEQGQLERAREHVQIYNQVLALLDELVEALGEQKMTARDYLEILQAGLDNLRLGLISPGLDQVFVGSLDRSRPAQVRANFLLGVNEGVLPKRPGKEGVLTDPERERLRLKGLKLAPDSKRMLFEEQYLIYQGLTRASEYLWVSYALADQEGNALHPSPLITQLQEVFPQNKVINCPLEPEGTKEDLDFIVTPKRTFSYLALRLREAQNEGQNLSSIWQEVYDWGLNQGGSADYARALAGLSHRNYEVNLSAPTCRQLYGSRLRISVTQIERFKSCPYAYFLQFGLSLKERETAKLRPLDLGQLFHAALKLFVQEVEQAGLCWPQVTQEISQQMASKISGQLIPQLSKELWLSSERQRYLGQKLRQIIQNSAWAVVEQIQAGSFRPLRLELAFGYPEGLPALRIPVSELNSAEANGTSEGEGTILELVGRIDRIDLASSEEGNYVRIIDYKSGSVRVNLIDLYYGLQLQLLAYLEAVLTGAPQLGLGEVWPGGLCYFSIQDPVISASSPPEPEQVAEEIQKRYKLKGFILRDQHLVDLMERGLTGTSRIIPVGRKKDGDFTSRSSLITQRQFKLLRSYLYRVLREAAREIMNGVVAIQPYQRKKRKACTYCPFKPVCQFDLLIGNRYHVQKNLSEAAIWQLLDVEVNEDAMDTAANRSDSNPRL